MTTSTSTTTDPSITTTPTSTSSSTSTTTGTLHRIEQSSAAVPFGGAWSLNNITAHSGSSANLLMSPGSRAAFMFTGNCIKWIAYRDQWSGIANVYIDGALKGSIDTYVSTTMARTAVYTASSLAWRTHTNTIEVASRRSASSQGNWVWVDVFNYVGL